MLTGGAVIKIGGSVLTDKTSSELVVDSSLLTAVAEELGACSVRPLVLVHGAGTFGHRIVARTGIHRTGLAGSASRLAMAETQRLQYVLATEVGRVLLAAGLPVIPVQASASAIMTDGRLERMDLVAVRLLIEQGLVPLFYGVPAVDRVRGCSILSGDVIVAAVAREFCIPLVVHATNTDGVFEADPHRVPAAQRLARIDRSNFDRVRPLLAGSAGVDVTGGMAGKVMALMDLAQTGTKSRIVDARIRGRIASALAGEDVGTLVSWEPT